MAILTCNSLSLLSLLVLMLVTDPTVSQTTDGAEDCPVMDLVFLLDSSGSIGSYDFQKEINFTVDFVDHFLVGPSLTQFAAATFASIALRWFDLDDHSDKASVTDALKRIPYSAGSTHTAAALEEARTYFFQESNGHRPGVFKVAVVATDGESNVNEHLTIDEANKLKDMDVAVFVLAVGSFRNYVEMEGIATHPSYVYRVEDYAVLEEYIPILINDICNSTGEEESGAGRADVSFSPLLLPALITMILLVFY